MVDLFYGLTNDPPAEYEFFTEHYKEDRELVLPYVKQALAPYMDLSDEEFKLTVVRHLDYAKGGGVGEHTDYGFLTFQISNEPGLEVFLDGKWYLLPPGAYVYAGDMTERLTNGAVKATKHRVRNAPGARGAHVFFTQPSEDTVIKVAEQYVSRQDPPLRTIKYGEWHDIKVNAAFGTTLIGTKVAES
jgi:isopenicillin N synthase-like dioxygenase